MPDFALEDECAAPVAGVDEAGRGPWAGPVVAGAVILPRDALPTSLLTQLDDSKKLKKSTREALYADLAAVADIGVGIATAAEIDTLNILHATMLAMRRAVEGLSDAPATALVDGNSPPDLACEVRTIVKGDTRSVSIAAASIVAKVTRDNIMTDLSAKHPGYGWERNAGYGTKEHQNALLQFGVTSAHRRSFAPIRKLLTTSSE
ncbi:MAG: ribonuclease HII [Pseudomonadota bacterium]|nr:ribonuclease HII [Pseudomonadota bacterium]